MKILVKCEKCDIPIMIYHADNKRDTNETLVTRCFKCKKFFPWNYIEAVKRAELFGFESNWTKWESEKIGISVEEYQYTI